MALPTEIISIGVMVGLAGAGVIGGILRWSILRNVETLDKKMDEIRASVADMGKSLTQLRSEAVTVNECAICRRECNERQVQYQQDILGWLRRSDDKADTLLMMIANLNNGMGGVTNGLGGKRG